MPVAVEKRVMFAPECVERQSQDTANSMIFQTMVPRRRRDRFGRDTTSHSDFLLSATVFPTGVRAPALEELQQKCGPGYRVETPREALRGMMPGESWPGSGPKVLTLRKNKGSPRDTPRDTPRSIQHHRSSNDSIVNLRSYTWVGKRKSRDVRDPMYINTYCPDERPLRFKESSLPRIGKSRPWSVGESNPSKRFVRVGSNVRKSAGKITSQTRIQGTPLNMSREPLHNAGNKQGGEQYFEVKRVSADHRLRQRGQDGCLYSQVRQCIRLVRNHDQNKGRQVDRPLKAEVGRYRPFSTTRIRTPCASPIPQHGLMFRDQDSADTYKQYVMTKVLQSRASTKSAGTVISGVAARNNTAVSIYQDSEILQSVADSNVPNGEQNPSSEFSQIGDNIHEEREIFNLRLDIRGSSIPVPKSAKSGKSKGTDSNFEKGRASRSPRKEVLVPCTREPSYKSKTEATMAHVPQESILVCTPEPEYQGNLEPIQLDESGNPLIWQHSHLTSTPDSAVIKIPAVAMSMLSIDDTEDDETHYES